MRCAAEEYGVHTIYDTTHTHVWPYDGQQFTALRGGSTRGRARQVRGAAQGAAKNTRYHADQGKLISYPHYSHIPSEHEEPPHHKEGVSTHSVAHT